MSTTTNWDREDQTAAIADAERRLAEAQADVDRLRAKLTDAEKAKDAAGVGGTELTGAEAGRAEAQRRIAARSGGQRPTNARDRDDEPQTDATAADGRAQALRRIEARKQGQR